MQKFLCVLNRMSSSLAMVSPVVDEKDLHFVIVDIMDKQILLACYSGLSWKYVALVFLTVLKLLAFFLMTVL